MFMIKTKEFITYDSFIH